MKICEALAAVCHVHDMVQKIPEDKNKPQSHISILSRERGKTYAYDAIKQHVKLFKQL